MQPDAVPTFSPLPENTKVVTVVDRLISAIAAGDFLPGSRLPSERSLAVSLQVGRGTIRSALQELADRHVIETRRGRNGGAFVLDSDSTATSEAVVKVFGGDIDKLKESVDAIALAYALASQTAAMRRDAQDVDTISRKLAAFREAVEQRDPRKAQAADAAFHRSIMDATKQPALHMIIRDLDRAVSLGAPLHIWGSKEQHEPMQKRALAEHTAIFHAIRDSDRTLAFDLTYSHALIDLDIILDLIDEGAYFKR